MHTAPKTLDATMRHRTGEVTLTVLEGDGSPLADTVVTVWQQRHAFAFGNIAFDLVRLIGGPGPEGVDGASSSSTTDADLDRLAGSWLNLFNTATLPFYWGRYEPRRGAPDAERLTKAARWLAERGVTVKGHPLVWHTVQPAWLLDLDLDTVERLQRARIRDLVGGFAGLIDAWDAINEAVIMPVFENGDNAITRLALARGRIFMLRMAFEEARAANPAAVLVLNDFDLSSGYECLIEGALEAGLPIDAIGLQTHMHQGYRGEQYMARTLDRSARFGLPLHLTETSLVSGHLMPPKVEDLNDYQIAHWPTTPEGEDRQADEIVRHYRTLVAHPAVESINYWGLTDEGAWLGAPVGLVRADGSPKPSYTALESLIKGEWWLPPTELRTDADGRVTVRGCGGVAGPGTRGRRHRTRRAHQPARITAYPRGGRGGRRRCQTGPDRYRPARAASGHGRRARWRRSTSSACSPSPSPTGRGTGRRASTGWYPGHGRRRCARTGTVTTTRRRWIAP